MCRIRIAIANEWLNDGIEDECKSLWQCDNRCCRGSRHHRHRANSEAKCIKLHLHHSMFDNHLQLTIKIALCKRIFIFISLWLFSSFLNKKKTTNGKKYEYKLCRNEWRRRRRRKLDIFLNFSWNWKGAILCVYIRISQRSHNKYVVYTIDASAHMSTIWNLDSQRNTDRPTDQLMASVLRSHIFLYQRIFPRLHWSEKCASKW